MDYEISLKGAILIPETTMVISRDIFNCQDSEVLLIYSG